MIDIIEDTKIKAVELMEKSIQAKKRGDYAKADDLYAESRFLLNLLKAAGEDLEGVRG